MRILIGITFLSGMVFLFVPYNNGEKHYWIVFSDRGVIPQNYVYHLFDKVGWVLMMFIIAATRKHAALWIVLLFYIVDLLDYVLTYNETLWMWGQFPISWNTVGSFMVLAALFFVDDDR